MLFNSQVFIIFYLPVVLIGYYLLRNHHNSRLLWLSLASILFYGYWDYRFLPLLGLSIALNWIIAKWFYHFQNTTLIYIGITLNLVLIGIFKYANFFAYNISGIFSVNFQGWDIILPLGISFFTFQQISYLVDLKNKNAALYPLNHYSMYVTFFPQLIAGPIVRHHEIIPQYTTAVSSEGLPEKFSQGAMLFVIGLSKKVIIADRLAETATPIFNSAQAGNPLSFMEGWMAALTYSGQIYFDFSGYSDMAIGLGLLFGLQIPYNFNAPYKSISVREFWRRWHITLSRFLRDYLYIPLGGNRHGMDRQFAAILITMLLGGLWHGAGWTFVAWGGLHGIAIAINAGWQKAGIRLPSFLCWFMTWIFVVTCWVIFRAENFSSALIVLKSMFHADRFGDLERIDYDIDIIITAWLIACLGPTSQRLVKQVIRPHPAIACVFGLTLVYLLLEIGNEGYTEFIYFQF